jgi:hypothetical protein
VRDSSVHNGDDCVPVTFGPDGTTSDVHVSNVSCACGTNGGVLYNTVGRISNVLFSNMRVTNTNQGAGAKIGRPNETAVGGLTTNVTWQDIVIDSPRYAALYSNIFNEDAEVGECRPSGTPPPAGWLTFTDFTFRNVTATVADGQAAGCFACSSAAPCARFAFDGVAVTQQGSGKPAAPYVCFNVANFSGGGGTAPGPCR